MFEEIKALRDKSLSWWREHFVQCDRCGIVVDRKRNVRTSKGGLCPCCGIKIIVDEAGKLIQG